MCSTVNLDAVTRQIPAPAKNRTPVMKHVSTNEISRLICNYSVSFLVFQPVDIMFMLICKGQFVCVF